MSSVDKAMQGAERTLTSDQEQDQEDQRKKEFSPPVKEFTIPDPRRSHGSSTLLRHPKEKRDLQRK